MSFIGDTCFTIYNAQTEKETSIFIIVGDTSIEGAKHKDAFLKFSSAEIEMWPDAIRDGNNNIILYAGPVRKGAKKSIFGDLG